METKNNVVNHYKKVRIVTDGDDGDGEIWTLLNVTITNDELIRGEHPYDNHLVVIRKWNYYEVMQE
jgi:hypothetical protein